MATKSYGLRGYQSNIFQKKQPNTNFLTYACLLSPDSKDPAVAKYHNITISQISQYPNYYQLLMLACFLLFQRTQLPPNITISQISQYPNNHQLLRLAFFPLIQRIQLSPNITISQISQYPNNHQLLRLAFFPLIQRTQLSPNILEVETIPKSFSRLLLRELAKWVQERAERRGSPFHKMW